MLPRLATCAAAAAMLALAAPTAGAGTILETATVGALGTNPGGSILSGQYLGARFELTETTEITGIGGKVVTFTAGSLFAAIVDLAGATALPSFDPADIDLPGNTEIGVTLSTAAPDSSEDVLVPVSVVLDPGFYALILGGRGDNVPTGAFGATGQGYMANDVTPIGSPSFFVGNTSGTWFDLDLSPVRFVVEGPPSAIPLPAGAWLLLGGLGGLAALRRRAG